MTCRQCLHLHNNRSRLRSRCALVRRLQVSSAVRHRSSQARQASGENAAAPTWAKANNKRVRRPQGSLPGHGTLRAESNQLEVSRNNQPTSTATAVSKRPSQQDLATNRQLRQQQVTQPMQAPVTGRKNPELYSLAAQHHDLAVPHLSSTKGVVGSTGTFGPAAANVANSNPSSQQLLHTSQQQQQQGVRLTNRPITKPEVLAPAGGWPQLRAAVENGADAVYFGVTGFNARAR